MAFPLKPDAELAIGVTMRQKGRGAFGPHHAVPHPYGTALAQGQPFLNRVHQPVQIMHGLRHFSNYSIGTLGWRRGLAKRPVNKSIEMLAKMAGADSSAGGN
jgi:hypothetical protein